MRSRILAALFLFVVQGFPLSAQAGTDDGLAAYRRQDWATAARELKPAADQGDLRALSHYGWMLINGFGLPKDTTEGLRLVQMAADGNDPNGLEWLGDVYSSGRGGVPIDFPRAIGYFKRAADLNQPVSLHNIGVFTLTGNGVPKDVTRGIELIRRAADMGLPASLNELGGIYWTGNGVPRDRTEAVQWFRKAAERGYPAAEVSLGDAYMAGDGIAQDRSTAAVWYRKAADQGFPRGQNRMGTLLIRGDGVPRDVDAGMQLLRKAVDAGDIQAAENLGIALWRGNMVPKDHPQAVQLLRRAGEKASPAAENLLGLALWTGDGVETNQSEAIQWFRRAAERNNADSQFNLGEAYAAGIGIERDRAEAYSWLLLAAQNAEAKDKVRFEGERDKLAAMLTPAESERGRSLASSRGGKPVSGPMPPANTSPTPNSIEQKQGRLMAGSGFFITRDGVVLTNSHVVQNCKSIRVTPADSVKSAEATVLGRDADNDFAVLKTGITSTSIRFREDKPMRAGDNVVVVGFPLSALLSREPNVTSGVISAMAGPRGDTRYFQITAPVQKGNSGGPLTDMSGNVVGVVSKKLNAMEVQKRFDDMPQNVSFAIKSDYARRFLTGNGVAFDTGSAKETLSAADVGERIRKSTVFVECQE